MSSMQRCGHASAVSVVACLSSLAAILVGLFAGCSSAQDVATSPLDPDASGARSEGANQANAGGNAGAGTGRPSGAGSDADASHDGSATSGSTGSDTEPPADAASLGDKGLLYAFNFEGASPLREDHGAFSLAQENEESADGISVVADPKDARNRVRKYTLRRSDTLSQCGNCQRVEDKIDHADWRAEMGREYWYGFRTLIRTSEWELGANSLGGDRWLTVAQWHDIPDNLYYGDGVQREEWKHPTLAIFVVNGKYKVVSHADPQAISVPMGGDWTAFDMRSIGCSAAYDWQGQLDKPPGVGCRWWESDMLADRAADRWAKWVFRVKWAADNSGLLQVWKDGTLLVDKANYPTSYNDYAGPTVKFGLYRSEPHAGSPYNGLYFDRSLYVDEYRVGDATATYQTVVPRGGN